jgi:toxin YoeB
MRSIEFDPIGFEDLVWWIVENRKMALRIVKLIREAQRTPFEGTGKPEPLRNELRGAWSRRIDGEHRLIYTVSEERVRILACRYHY